jgi:hypothetical protein
MSSRSVHSSLEFEYEEFRRHPNPFGLADELAQARTLLVEFREAVEACSLEKVSAFCEGIGLAIAQNVRDIVGHAMGIPEEDKATHKGLGKLAKAIVGATRDDVYYMYEKIFGPASRITPEQARTMAGLLKTVGDLAEKFKKMSEGVTLTVAYDKETIDMMARFLSICILPYCSVEQKAIIGDQALRFLPGLQADMISPSQVIEVEAHG